MRVLHSGAMVGILVQAGFLLTLAVCLLASGALRYRAAAPVAAGKAVASRGPAEGWQLFAAPVGLYEGLAAFLLTLAAVAYAAMLVWSLASRRRIGLAWWCLPLTCAAVAMAALAFFWHPRILS